MQVLNCSTKLLILEKLLKSHFPESLKVYGAVMNINRGNPFQKEVVLDSWPDFKAIITRRQKEAETDNLDHYTNAYAVFYKDVNAYRRLLEEHGVINWDQVFQIQGLQSELYDVSKAVADSKQVDVKLASFKATCLPLISTADTSFLYVNQASSRGELVLWQYKLQSLEYLIPLRNIGFSRSVCLTLCNPVDSSLPASSVHGILQARRVERVASFFSRMNSSVQLTYLSIADVDLLNQTWSRGGNEQCRRYIANLISCFPSVCVRDDKGNPLSWSMMDQFATMCHGYTMPEHRRKGYNRLVILMLARKLQSRGFPCQGNILEDNTKSINLAKSIHCDFLPCRFHRLILTPPAFSGQVHP